MGIFTRFFLNLHVYLAHFFRILGKMFSEIERISRRQRKQLIFSTRGEKTNLFLIDLKNFHRKSQNGSQSWQKREFIIKIHQVSSVAFRVILGSLLCQLSEFIHVQLTIFIYVCNTSGCFTHSKFHLSYILPLFSN